MLITWFSIAILLVAAVVFYLFVYPRWRRQRITARPFPDSWKNLLDRNMSLYRALPAELKERLHPLIQIFLDEKRFYGCDGLRVTDAMRVIIAAHACLLILNRGIHHYDRLSSILIYPSVYRAQDEFYDHDGVVNIHASERLGESWHEGRVVLSWLDVIKDARAEVPGSNVCLHEFSHQLDQTNGPADGYPELLPGHSPQEWSQVFEQEFRQLRDQLELAPPAVLDEYGAEDPAEFFAVATEAFFTKPRELRKQHPRLYEQLQGYYQLDPQTWRLDRTDPGPLIGSVS